MNIISACMPLASCAPGLPGYNPGVPGDIPFFVRHGAGSFRHDTRWIGSAVGVMGAMVVCNLPFTGFNRTGSPVCSGAIPAGANQIWMAAVLTVQPMLFPAGRPPSLIVVMLAEPVQTSSAQPVHSDRHPRQESLRVRRVASDSRGPCVQPRQAASVVGQPGCA